MTAQANTAMTTFVPQIPWAETVTGLTDLSGSEKQIAWAESLRRNALLHLRDYYSEGRREDLRTQGFEVPAGEDFSVQVVNLVSEAKWYIDHCRGPLSALTVLKTLTRTHGAAIRNLYAQYKI